MQVPGSFDRVFFKTLSRKDSSQLTQKRKTLTAIHSQSTLTLILLETLGGTPLLAMQRYDPMSRREIRDTSNVSPSHSVTVNYCQG